MSAPKRTKGQREEDLHFIQELYVRGRSLREIAKALGRVRDYTLSHRQIGNDVQLILERWRAATIENVDALKAAELARLNEIEREAWAEWERSKTKREKTLSERSTGTTYGEKARITRESLLGDPRYLQVIQQCIKQRVDILGLNAPAEHNVKISSWAELLKSVEADASSVEADA